MVTKSHGKLKGTRSKFRKSIRLNINKFLRKFVDGDKVAVVIESASVSGRPFRRFQGLTGTVEGKRGHSYLVKIRDGKKYKTIIAKPEHLKKI